MATATKTKSLNTDAGDFWLVYDGYQVTIAEQKLGEHPTQKITVPIREFRKLVRKFVKQQKYRPH